MSIISEFNQEQLKEIVKNSSSYTEVIHKIGYKSNSAIGTVIKYLEENNISTEHFTHQAKGTVVRNEENIFIEHSTASQKVLRNWYKKGNYTEYKCAICGQEPFWNGKELVLTLDHINGINNDDRLENLRWVCPNCDRQLDTFAGKNIPNKKEYYNCQLNKEIHYCIDCGIELKSSTSQRCIVCSGKAQRHVERPDKEQLQQILQENKGNFTAVARLYGVSDNAIRKWCKKYDIPSSSSAYKIK